MSEFAQRVRELRCARGFTKSGFARAVGVSPACVWSWEHRGSVPRPEALQRIAVVLNCAIESLDGRARSQGADEARFPTTVPPIGQDDMPPLAKVILRARCDIAQVAGVHVERVKVILEYAG